MLWVMSWERKPATVVNAPIRTRAVQSMKWRLLIPACLSTINSGRRSG